MHCMLPCRMAMLAAVAVLLLIPEGARAECTCCALPSLTLCSRPVACAAMSSRRYARLEQGVDLSEDAQLRQLEAGAARRVRRRIPTIRRPSAADHTRTEMSLRYTLQVHGHKRRT